MEGSGKMVVTAVGMNSQAGIIVALLGATTHELDNAAAADSAGKTPYLYLFFTCTYYRRRLHGGDGAIAPTAENLWGDTIIFALHRRLTAYGALPAP